MAPDTAQAAPMVSIDFTVRESLPAGSPGSMISSDISSCASATVTTAGATRTESGPLAIFTGTKLIDCGCANTFTLWFWVNSRECLQTDRGGWAITSGTGLFAGARGHGRLIGTYHLRDGPGTFCDSDGIDDHYIGGIRLA